MQLERLRVRRVTLQHQHHLLDRLGAGPDALQRARELQPRGVEVGVQLESVRQRAERVVELPPLEFGRAQQVVQVGPYRVVGERRLQDLDGPRRVAGLEPGAGRDGLSGSRRSPRRRSGFVTSARRA